METFGRHLLREASLHKLDALLRLPPSGGLQPGYVPVEPYLGGRAPQDLCNLALRVNDQTLGRTGEHVAAIPTADLVPTQYAIYLPDVRDIVSKGGNASPIRVLRHTGRYYIVNGHHRAVSNVLLHQPYTRAYVSELPL